MIFGVNHFSAAVLVDDQPVKEYVADDNTWVSLQDTRTRMLPPRAILLLAVVLKGLLTVSCHSGLVQVESTFDAKSTFREEVEESDPFGDTYKQTWPFTPFKVKVSLLELTPPAGKYYWAEVCWISCSLVAHCFSPF